MGLGPSCETANCKAVQVFPNIFLTRNFIIVFIRCLQLSIHWLQNIAQKITKEKKQSFSTCLWTSALNPKRSRSVIIKCFLQCHTRTISNKSRQLDTFWLHCIPREVSLNMSIFKWRHNFMPRNNLSLNSLPPDKPYFLMQATSRACLED
jgi:hypothetical protein